MTAEKAIELYSNKFGGFPFFLFMGAEEAEIVSAVKEALETGKEIEPLEDLIY